MIIESGVIIFIGFLLFALKLPHRVSLRLLGYPLTLDLSASAIAYFLHYGTFSGVMAAAVAGLLMSSCVSISRYLFGFIKNGRYIPGKIFKLDPQTLK